MTTKVTSADFKPEIQQQLQQQLSLQSQSNQNLQLVLNSIIKKKRPIPAFLNKLYNMVADSKTDQYIHWSEEGTSFIVPNQDDFSKQVLPRFFKHNNFTSFIRQLNMYGFHKVPNVQQGSLLSGQEAEALEFANEYFIRDRPELLLHCSRRKNSPQEEVVQKEEKQDLGMILVELSQIKRQQLSISTEIAKMQRENQALWQQSLQLQQQYDKQKDTIEKIVGFLASVFHKKKLSTGAAKKRKLLLDDADSELDENQILNFFTEHGKSEPPLSLDIPVTIDPTLSDAPKLTELPEVPDTNFNAFDTHLTNLSDHVDLLQDQIYGIGSAVGVDNLNDLNWTTTSNPANGEALMELIGTGDGEELKHKKDEDFDFDEFFNQ